jgi:hypothetical protein
MRSLALAIALILTPATTEQLSLTPFWERWSIYLMGGSEGDNADCSPTALYAIYYDSCNLRAVKLI